MGEATEHTPKSADERWMRRALDEALAAAEAGEVPVGAVVVSGDQVVAVDRNRREELQDPVAHAEILALQQAARRIGHWRLEGCTLYVTLEPCPMCAGAAVNGRLSRLVYGARDPKAGAVESLFAIPTDQRLNHRPAVTGGILARECGEVLSRFFQDLRRRK